MRKSYLVASLIAMIIGLVGFIYYHNSQSTIFQRILHKEGYIVTEIDKPIHFDIKINPDWIPQRKGPEKKLNYKIGTVHNTDILLESVIHRDNDIFFYFNAVPRVNKDYGTFLYIDEIHDNSFSTYSPIGGEWRFFDNANREIAELVRNFGTGEGPGNHFGVFVVDDYLNLLNNGVTIRFSGFILYEYKNIKS